MNIKEILFSHRNDFRAIYSCPFCGTEFEAWGYSDTYFYDIVLPNAICPTCGKNSLGENPEELEARTGRVYMI